MANFVNRTRNGARLCEGPPCTKNRPRAQPRPKITSRRPGRLLRPAEKGHKNGWAIALGMGLAKFVCRSRNGVRLCERPPCPKNRPRAQPLPKITARRPGRQVRLAEKGHEKGCAIALGDGAGQVRPPDSEWEDTSRTTSCAKIGSGHSRAQ